MSHSDTNCRNRKLETKFRSQSTKVLVKLKILNSDTKPKLEKTGQPKVKIMDFKIMHFKIMHFKIMHFKIMHFKSKNV